MAPANVNYIKISIHSCPNTFANKEVKSSGFLSQNIHTTAELIKFLFKFANTRLISKTPFYQKKNVSVGYEFVALLSSSFLHMNNRKVWNG